MSTEKTPLKNESHPSCLGAVVCRFLFQYRSMGKDLMVHIEASSLNDAMVKFATHYHLIDEVYEIARVS